jgi:ribosomal protein S27AE
MKNSNTCPKCQSRDIMRIPGSNSENYIPFGLTVFTAIPVTRYLCGQCGFIEEWIDSQDDIEQLRRKYGN